MANINGNNTDDLFRQASDQYPLRTDSADWDKVAKALDANPSLILPAVSDRGRRRRVLWLLLLLALGGLGYFTWRVSNSHATANGIAKLKPVGTIEPAGSTVPGGSGLPEGSAVGSADVARREPAGPGAGIKPGGGATVAGGGGATVVAGNGTAGGQGDKGDDVSRRNMVKPGREGTAGAGTSGVAGVKRTARAGTSEVAAGVGDGGEGAVNGAKSVRGTAGVAMTNGKVKQSGENLKGIKNVDGHTNEVTGGNEVTAGAAGAGIGQDAKYSQVNTPRAVTKTGPSPDVTVRATEGQTAANTKRAPAAALKKSKDPQHHFYVGLLGAPDMSTVKMQSVSSAGTTFGILGGYALNAKWSVETGAYIDVKKYYTEGQYFSKKNVQPLWNVNLMNVNGICNMVEIPVNLRYNISTGKKMKWFATAGLSTYLMSKEQYSYQYSYAGGAPMTNNYTYMTPYRNWFSIVDLSMGFEQKLGNIGSLRIEPYLRMPLAGIGTGNLPIMSAGLNIGITRSIR